MVTSYLLFFYTDVFGITAAGTLFLITRMRDAITDTPMGVIVHKTKSKYGKARPYLLYLAIPLAILSVATLTLLNEANLVGGFVALFLLKRWGSRNSSIIMYSTAVLIFVILIIMDDQSMILFASLFFIVNISTSYGDPANLTMVGDTVDYHELRFGERVEGLLVSSYSFALKVGVAFGSAFVGYALSWAGYNPESIADQAQNMIRILTFGIPLILTALQAITLIFYKLDKYHPAIINDLNEREGY